MIGETRLGHGRWLGRCDLRHDAAGFAVVRSTPTVPAREVARHVHPEAHAILLLSGHYLSGARGAGEALSPGAVVFNPAGTEHRDRFAALEGGRFLGISVDAARERELGAAVRFAEGARLAEPRAAAIAAAVDRALGEGEALALEALCLELFAALGEVEEARRHPPWLPRVEALLHDRCAEPLAVSDLAREAGVHPVHLARVFRRFLRTTPGGYLRRCRLERARALLRRRGPGIAEVALACGFHDQSHLGRAFRAAYGTTPGRYRAAAAP